MDRRVIGANGLTDLYLGQTRLTDASIDSIGKLTKLQTIALAGTMVTADGFESLQTLLPTAKIVK